MEICDYEEVANDSEIVRKNNSSTWKPLLKQLVVCGGVWTSIFLNGMSVGAPTVFIPQIRKEFGDEAISENLASWIISAYGFTGFAFVPILSILSRFLGRKTQFIIALLISLVAFTILYFSSNSTFILISQVTQGYFSAAQIVVTVMILTEYTSPNYRGVFLTIKSATVYWGIWTSNAIGTFFHWKYIAIFGILCALFALITSAYWPESPYWLASKGRFKECATSHRWLKGSNEQSEKELQNLIDSHKEYLRSYDNSKNSTAEQIKYFFKTIVSKNFYRPVIISYVTFLLSLSTGKIVCALYALDIIKTITKSDSTSYTTMLILDGVTVFSMYGGCILSKYTKRRSFLLVSSSIAVAFLLSLALYLYLIKLDVILENKYITVLLLTTLSIAVSGGPLLISAPVSCELLPIRSRNLSMCVCAVSALLNIALTLKLSPYIYKAIGLHGLFLGFGIYTFIIILVLYKYLPETQGKTIQEITDEINGVTSKRGNKKLKLLVDKI